MAGSGIVVGNASTGRNKEEQVDTSTGQRIENHYERGTPFLLRSRNSYPPKRREGAEGRKARELKE